jgi:hypothetical protein
MWCYLSHNQLINNGIHHYLVGPEKVINAQALTAMTPWTLVCATMSLTLLFEKTEARDKYGVKRQLPT